MDPASQGRFVTVENAADLELIERARRGNPGAIGALYERYAPALHTLARRIVGSATDADDVLHDVFLALPQLLLRYEHRDRLEPWLRAVVTTNALMRLRQRRRRDRFESRSTEPERAPGPTTDPWTALDLDRAVVGLPDSLRVVFVLKEWEGYSHAEIAARLGISSAASRTRFTRALRRLRNILEPGS